MTNAEKARLTALVLRAANELDVGDRRIQARIRKCANKYSPTNHQCFRDLAEIAWWLVAADSKPDALRILNALCELNDTYYWMFQALASSFASRAWLSSQLENSRQSSADAATALTWLNREPNAKPLTKKEVRENLQRFDGWIARAENEEGAVTAVHVLSHALRVLVIYQQMAALDHESAKVIEPNEYSYRVDDALRRLRERLEDLPA